MKLNFLIGQQEDRQQIARLSDNFAGHRTAVHLT
jgi:hypothetical protein